jgi:hypothetical protein
MGPGMWRSIAARMPGRTREPGAPEHRADLRRRRGGVILNHAILEKACATPTTRIANCAKHR